MKKTSRVSPSLFPAACALALIFALGGCSDLPTAKQEYMTGKYVPARMQVDDLIHRGFPGAETLLGQMYMEGRGVPPDPKKGLALFHHAETTENFAPASIEIGRAYRAGTGVPRDPAMARRQYQRALRRGDTDAYIELGLLEQDAGRFSAAEDDFKKAQTAGNIGGLRALGNLHAQEGKAAQAEGELKTVIARGVPWAWHDLGRIYEKQGRWRDAEDSYQRALDAGDLGASIALGATQEAQGRYEVAEGTYKKAFDGGLNRAALKIGDLYRDGRGRHTDTARALYWYHAGLTKGADRAGRRITSTEKKMQPEDLAKAFHFTRTTQ